MTPLQLKYPMSVAILYSGGDTADLQDTVDTVEQIVEALEERGHVVRTMEVTKKNWRKAVRLPGEVVFNLVEDPTWDLYMKVGLWLERMGRAQVGQDLRSFRYVVSKAAMKRRIDRLGGGTPAFRVFNRRSRIKGVRGLEYPLIVKPSCQHAGIGISQDSVVIDEEELRERVAYCFKHYKGEVVAEEYIEGREMHVTVIGNGRHVVVLPYVELFFKGEFADNWDIYTYEAKWVHESWEYWNVPLKVPAEVSTKLDRRIEKLCQRAYKGLGCRDIVRFDIRVDNKENPLIIDVNMSPSLGYHPNEEVWRAAEVLGWSYAEMVETVAAITYKRAYGRMPDRIRERQRLLAYGE